MQLGADHWFESTVDGLKVKNFKRRMALFPNKAGKLKIGSFIHHLTLLDENNKWFSHDIQSNPIVLDVQAAPATEDWWFPVRKLEVSDRWSNAPDQLGKGDGVLRVITLTATGVGADMMPPMPELKSPSAFIFPHPEKRLVDLSPNGPVAITFWRWTIKPRNGVSAILEPVEFSYFDTTNRKSGMVSISAQRVAYSHAITPSAAIQQTNPFSYTMRSGLMGSIVLLCFSLGIVAASGREKVFSLQMLKRWWQMLKLKRALKKAVTVRNLGGMRRAGYALNNSLPECSEREKLLVQLDRKIFSSNPEAFDFSMFHNRFRSTM